jgi:hypothetical protein
LVATQTFRHPRSSTAERLRAQAEGHHYSTFSLYAPDELRASIAAFLAAGPAPRSPGLTSTSWSSSAGTAATRRCLTVRAARRPGRSRIGSRLSRSAPRTPVAPASRRLIVVNSVDDRAVARSGSTVWRLWRGLRGFLPRLTQRSSCGRAGRFSLTIGRVNAVSWRLLRVTADGELCCPSGLSGKEWNSSCMAVWHDAQPTIAADSRSQDNSACVRGARSFPCQSGSPPIPEGTDARAEGRADRCRLRLRLVSCLHRLANSSKNSALRWEGRNDG